MASAQHLDPFDRAHGNRVDVDYLSRGPGIGTRQQGGDIATLAVDQYQGVPRANATQRGGAHALTLDRILALREVERRIQLRERLIQVDGTRLLQFRARDHIDRYSAGERRDVGTRRPQHHDRIERF